jgi:hypothetical protein
VDRDLSYEYEFNSDHTNDSLNRAFLYFVVRFKGIIIMEFIIIYEMVTVSLSYQSIMNS